MRSRKVYPVIGIIILLFIMFTLVAWNGNNDNGILCTNTPTFTATSTETPTDTPTPTSTSTNIPTLTSTSTDTPTLTPTDTEVPTSTYTFTPTATPTETIDPRTATPTQTYIQTPSPTSTVVPTGTPIPTDTPIPTSTPYPPKPGKVDSFASSYPGAFLGIMVIDKNSYALYQGVNAKDGSLLLPTNVRGAALYQHVVWIHRLWRIGWLDIQVGSIVIIKNDIYIVTKTDYIDYGIYPKTNLPGIQYIATCYADVSQAWVGVELYELKLIRPTTKYIMQ